MNDKQDKYTRTSFGVRKITTFDVVNCTLFILLCFVMLYPFWNVLMVSLVGPSEAMNRIFIPWPRDMTFISYQYIFTTDKFPRAFLVTAFITVAGTLYGLVLASTCAYALTKKTVPGYKFFSWMITFTMFFGGGLIPYYMLIRALGLMNTVWVLFLGGMGVFTFLLMRSFINQIPEGLEESATIDGANELKIFYRIIIPLSLPVLAVLTLFSAVCLWNSWFAAMLYLPTRPDLNTLQLLLRRLIVEASKIGDADMQYRARFGHDAVIFEDGIKMAAVIVATAPILIVYPFLQKYFVKGVMVGSLKG